jgi:hypothetical protein
MIIITKIKLYTNQTMFYILSKGSTRSLPAVCVHAGEPKRYTIIEQDRERIQKLTAARRSLWISLAICKTITKYKPKKW